MKGDDISKKDMEREKLLTTDNFQLAQMIGRKLKEVFPQYDFWAVDSSSDGIGVFTGPNLPEDVWHKLYGYAKALLDMLHFIGPK